MINAVLGNKRIYGLIAGGFLLLPGFVPAVAGPYSSAPRLPDDMREVAQLAADAFKRQNYDEAAALYQSIIQKYPDCLYAWSNLGVVRFQQGDFNKAKDDFDRALKLNPDDALTLVNSGIVDFQPNRFDDAISRLEAAVALDPNDAAAHSFLSSAYRRVGRVKDADEQSLQARSLDK